MIQSRSEESPSKVSLPVSNRQPRPAMVVGVSGNTDPSGYVDILPEGEHEDSRIIAVREKVVAILDWIFADPNCGFLNPATGKFDPNSPRVEDRKDEKGNISEYCRCWRPLGLRNTPLIVLSSLAPGIDTLVAETVLDYAKNHPALDISVRAPLPFPLELYSSSTTYCPAGKEATWANKGMRLAKLLEKLRSQTGWDEARDIFCVSLDNDLEGDPKEDLTREDNGKARRHLRYRAAGEYVATYSDLLIAIHDAESDGEGQPFDLYSAGTATIVAAKKRGLAWELLAESNNFSWADNGPVLRMLVRREKRKAGSPAARLKNGPLLEFIHPLDAQPEPANGVDPFVAWQASGDYTFRRIIALQEAFNEKSNDRPEQESIEWHSLLLGSSALGKLGTVDARENAVRNELGEEGYQFAMPLDTLARVRKRAAVLSETLNKRRTRLLQTMILLIGVAALGLGAFEHWHPQVVAHGEALSQGGAGHTGRERAAFLFVTLSCLMLSAMLHFLHVRRKAETRQFDARSIGEALRVQFYWCLAGLSRSVPGNYMQRQRDELDWIRYVVSAVSFPYDRWREGFADLDASSQYRLLQTVRKRWISSQLGYFKSNLLKLDLRLHVWHVLAWGFGAGGLVQVILMAFDEAWVPAAHFLEESRQIVAVVMLVLSLPGVVSFVWHVWKHEHNHELPPEVASDQSVPVHFFRWIFSAFEVWSFGLLVAANVFLLPFELKAFSENFPDRHDWWIILTGASLLTGGLSLAWSERNLFAELHRQYGSMKSLYRCADRRLAELLDRLKPLDDKADPERQRLLAEIHDTIYQLGCEALDENAEWLILHRARPLEPFMAG